MNKIYTKPEIIRNFDPASFEDNPKTKDIFWIPIDYHKGELGEEIRAVWKEIDDIREYCAVCDCLKISENRLVDKKNYGWSNIGEWHMIWQELIVNIWDNPAYIKYYYDCRNDISHIDIKDYNLANKKQRKQLVKEFNSLYKLVPNWQNHRGNENSRGLSPEEEKIIEDLYITSISEFPRYFQNCGKERENYVKNDYHKRTGFELEEKQYKKCRSRANKRLKMETATQQAR